MYSTDKSIYPLCTVFCHGCFFSCSKCYINYTPVSAKLMISEVSSTTSLLVACPSRFGISTLPSSRTFPEWSFRSAVTIAAFGMGWVMLGLSFICNLLRICLFTASRKSMSTLPDSSGWPMPHDVQVSWDTVCVSVPGATVQFMESAQATNNATLIIQLLIFFTTIILKHGAE